MMSLTLQPAVTTTPIDGLLVQSQTKDSDAAQSLSFGEVLKVEEKKLQQEMELNAPTLVATFAMIQPPALIAPAMINSSADIISDQANAQTISTVDSVQLAKSQSARNDVPINSTAVVPQPVASKTFSVETYQAAQLQSVTPNIEVAQADTSPTKTDSRPVSIVTVQTPVSAEIPQSVNMPSAPVQTSAPSEMSHPASKPNTPIANMVSADVPNQSEVALKVENQSKPVATVKTSALDEMSQPVSKPNTPTANVISVDAPSQSEVAPRIETQSKPVATVKTSAPDEMSQPAGKPSVAVNVPSQSEVKPKVETQAKPAMMAQTSMPTETSQPESKPSAPVNIPSQSEVTLKAETQAKPVVTAQTSVPAEMSQPVEKPNAPLNVPSQSEVTPKVEIQSKPVVARQTSQTVNKPNMPVNFPSQSEVTSKVEMQSKPVATEKTSGPVETPQPAEKPIASVNVPSQSEVTPKVETQSKPMVTEKISVPTEISKPVGKVANVAQSVSTDLHELRQGLPSVPPESGTENLSGSAIRPTVETSAPVGEQGNVGAKVNVGGVEQSSGVGIQPDKKELKKPAVESDSAVMVDASKGSVDVKVAVKAPVTQIDASAFDVIQQITNQMKTRIQGGETSIRMTINPKELGAIEVQVTHSAQGVSVSFVAEKSGTSQLLESQASQLRQSLKDAGVQLTNLNISQQNQNHEGGGFRQGQPFVQSERREVLRSEILNEERLRPQRIDGLTSEIDYLV